MSGRSRPIGVHPGRQCDHRCSRHFPKLFASQQLRDYWFHRRNPVCHRERRCVERVPPRFRSARIPPVAIPGRSSAQRRNSAWPQPVCERARRTCHRPNRTYLPALESARHACRPRDRWIGRFRRQPSPRCRSPARIRRSSAAPPAPARHPVRRSSRPPHRPRRHPTTGLRRQARPKAAPPPDRPRRRSLATPHPAPRGPSDRSTALRSPGRPLGIRSAIRQVRRHRRCPSTASRPRDRRSAGARHRRTGPSDHRRGCRNDLARPLRNISTCALPAPRRIKPMTY